MASSPGATALDWLGGLGRSIGVDRPTTGSRIRRVLVAAARAADQPTGILVVPDLDGSRDSSLAGGAMAGLRLDVDAATMARGVLEGIAFDVADELDLLSVEGLDVAEIRVSGGGASDARLLQLRADVIGIPVVGVDPRDTGVAAAAAMAWTAAVGDRSMTDALASLVRLGPAVEPRAGHHQRYAELRARRRALRMALAEPVDRRLATRR
jgi:sugar (pentulose or hexulose) kinase